MHAGRFPEGLRRCGDGSSSQAKSTERGFAVQKHCNQCRPALSYGALNQVTDANFGTLISYLAPGAVALIGVSQFSTTVRVWFASSPENAPTIGGFLYLTVASIAAGMTVSAVRWLVIDSTHGWTGIRLPAWDFRKLSGSVEAFSLLIEIHYRHYLFYANMFVATAFAFACYRYSVGGTRPLGWLDVGVVALEAIFYLASRDTLQKYYRRGEQLLGRGLTDARSQQKRA
jgi:hypothetical protein